MSKTKKNISQWIGVILALTLSPFIFIVTITAGQMWLGDTVWGLIVGVLLLLIGIYVFALIISKIVFFIIK